MVALAVGVAIGAVLYVRGWDRYVEAGLGNWAVDEVARRTDGAYRLILGDLDFRPIAGSLSFDSAIVVTDTVANRARAVPLPNLNVRADGCRISGVSVALLLLRHRFDARHMGCGSVTAGVQLQRLPGRVADGPDPTDAQAPRERRPPPLGITLFHITDIAFPTLAFSLQRPGPRGESSVSMKRARVTADLVELDPTAPLGAQNALLTQGVRFDASGFLLRPDTVSEFAIGAIRAGITDSTFRLDSIIYGLRISDDAWARTQRHRRDRITFALSRLSGRGVAYRTFLRTGDINIRVLELSGARLNVLSDKRLKPGPPGRHSTPQQAAQRSNPALRVDTVLIHGSQIVYQEHKPDREDAGQLTFAQLECRIANVDVPSRGSPLLIDASARLMNEGLLTVHDTVPLDAPDFRFGLGGGLGPMPFTALNPFLQETTPVRLKAGQVDSVMFVMRARGGVSTTTVTPYYRDLAIDFTSGGVLGFVKAGVVEFAANKFKVRSQNPEEAGKKPRSTTASRSYEPTRSWLSFLWISLRDPLIKTIVK